MENILPSNTPINKDSNFLIRVDNGVGEKGDTYIIPCNVALSNSPDRFKANDETLLNGIMSIFCLAEDDPRDLNTDFSLGEQSHFFDILNQYAVEQDDSFNAMVSIPNLVNFAFRAMLIVPAP